MIPERAGLFRVQGCYRRLVTHVHAFSDDALGDHDAVGLVAALTSGSVSREEVIDAAITRAEKVNPELNGLAYDAFDRARARAAAPVPYGGFFDGVPTFVKDNVEVAGMPTMRGTDAWQPQPAVADGDFARGYLSTGLIPIGRSRMSEFGFSAVCEHPRLGPVRNPWNVVHTAGASSSGSGAFVAAGVVPIAHGNDGGGSIRIPASCNGVVGLKPTQGRVPLDKAMRDMPIKIVHDGVLTRSVRDTAAFYRELEKTYPPRKLPPIGDVSGPAERRLRIGVLTQSLRTDPTPEVLGATGATAALLEDLGHHVEYLDGPPVPDSFAEDFLLYWALLALALVRGGKRTFGPTFDKSRLDNLSIGLDRHAVRNLHRIPLAIARLSRTRRHTARLHRRYDVVLSPTLATAPPEIGHLDPTADYDQIVSRLIDWVAFTPLTNVTGEPTISLPLAASGTGLPIGMMFAAGFGEDALLLQLAYELEAARPFRRIQ